MTTVTDFQRLQVGSERPYTLDIEPIGGHESNGIMATFFSLPSIGRGHYGVRRAELRYRDGEFALFLFRFRDQELPEWWQDSEIVWKLEE